MTSYYRIMGKFRGQNFRRKANEVDFESLIFVYVPSSGNKFLARIKINTQL